MLARLLLVVGGLAVGLLLVEASLRVAGVAYPLPYLPDRHVGSRLQPGFTAWFTSEGRALVRVNRAGFRDRPHARVKPPGTLRIAVLGDSFAEAVQVPRDATFWAVLERELAGSSALAGRQVEVLNFGISGHGTAQHLQMLRHYVWAYDPDVVLLAFFAGNDIRNNSRQLEPDPVRPFFRLAGDQLVLDDAFLSHPDFRKANSSPVRAKVSLINRSRVLQVLNRWKHQSPPRGRGDAYFEPGIDDRYLLEPPDDAWRQAWRLTERLIVQIDREARARGARLFVATVTQAVQVHPEPAVRQQFAQRLGANDLLYPERRLARLAQQQGFTLIPLAEPMAAHARQRGVYLHGFDNTALGTGHWNAAGHRLAGELIARAMIAQWSRPQAVDAAGGGEATPSP